MFNIFQDLCILYLGYNGLEARTVHGRKGTDINVITAYNPNAAEVYSNALNALNDVSCPLFECLETYASNNLSYLQALPVIGTNESIEDESGTMKNPTSSIFGGGTRIFNNKGTKAVVTAGSNSVPDEPLTSISMGLEARTVHGRKGTDI
nr:hypothetical protein [Tanacetum cinerariifolium]